MSATSILREIASRPSGVTRAGIGSSAGLSADAIDRAVQRLISRGLVVERPQRARMIGRVIERPEPLLVVTVAGHRVLRRRDDRSTHPSQPILWAGPLFGGGWQD